MNAAVPVAGAYASPAAYGISSTSARRGAITDATAVGGSPQQAGQRQQSAATGGRSSQQARQPLPTATAAGRSLQQGGVHHSSASADIASQLQGSPPLPTAAAAGFSHQQEPLHHSSATCAGASQLQGSPPLPTAAAAGYSHHQELMHHSSAAAAGASQLQGPPPLPTAATAGRSLQHGGVHHSSASADGASQLQSSPPLPTVAAAGFSHQQEPLHHSSATCAGASQLQGSPPLPTAAAAGYSHQQELMHHSSAAAAGASQLQGPPPLPTTAAAGRSLQQGGVHHSSASADGASLLQGPPPLPTAATAGYSHQQELMHHSSAAADRASHLQGSPPLHTAAAARYSSQQELLHHSSAAAAGASQLQGSPPRPTAAAAGYSSQQEPLHHSSAAAAGASQLQGSSPLHTAAAAGYSSQQELLHHSSAAAAGASQLQGSPPLPTAAAAGYSSQQEPLHHSSAAAAGASLLQGPPPLPTTAAAGYSPQQEDLHLPTATSAFDIWLQGPPPLPTTADAGFAAEQVGMHQFTAAADPGCVSHEPQPLASAAAAGQYTQQGNNQYTTNAATAAAQFDNSQPPSRPISPPSVHRMEGMATEDGPSSPFVLPNHTRVPTRGVVANPAPEREPVYVAAFQTHLGETLGPAPPTGDGAAVGRAEFDAMMAEVRRLQRENLTLQNQVAAYGRSQSPSPSSSSNDDDEHASPHEPPSQPLGVPAQRAQPQVILANRHTVGTAVGEAHNMGIATDYNTIAPDLEPFATKLAAAMKTIPPANGGLYVRIGGGAGLPLHLCGLCIGWGLLSLVPLLMVPPRVFSPPSFVSAGAHWRCPLEVVQGCHFTSVRIGGGAGLPLHLCGLCIGWGLLSVVPLLMVPPRVFSPPSFVSAGAHWRCALGVVQGCNFTSVGYALAGASSLCALEVVQGCHFTSVRIGGGAGLPLHLCGLCIGWGLLSVVPLPMAPPSVFSPPSFVSAGAHWRCALEVVQGCHFTSVGYALAGASSLCALEVVQGCHFTSVRIGGGAGMPLHLCGLCIGWGLLSVVPLLMAPPPLCFSPHRLSLQVRIGGGAGLPLHLCGLCPLEVVQGCHFTSVRIRGGAGLPLHLCGLCIGWGLLSVVPLLMVPPRVFSPPSFVSAGAHWRCALEVVQGCHFTSVGYALAGASSLCALEVVQGCHFTSVRIGGGAGLPLHLCGLCIGWGLLSVVPLPMAPPRVFSPPSFVSAGAHWRWCRAATSPLWAMHWLGPPLCSAPTHGSPPCVFPPIVCLCRCALEVVQGCHFTSVRIGGGAGLTLHLCGLCIGWGLLSVRIGGGAGLPLHLCGLCIGWGLLSVVPLPMAPPRVFSPPSFVSAGAHWRCALEVVQGCHFTSVRIGGGAGLTLHLCGLCIGWGLLSVRIGGGAGLPLHLCGLCIGWGLLSVRIGGGAGLPLHLCGLCIGWGLLSVVPPLMAFPPCVFPPIVCLCRCALEVVQGCHFTSVPIGGGAGLPLHLCGLCIGWGLLSVVPLLMVPPRVFFPPSFVSAGAHWRCALEVVQGCHFTSVRIGGGAGLPLHLCGLCIGWGLLSVRIGGGAGLPLHLCGLCIGWGLLSVVPLPMAPPRVFSPPSFVSAGAHWRWCRAATSPLWAMHWLGPPLCSAPTHGSPPCVFPPIVCLYRCALEVVQGCHFTSVRIGGGAGLPLHLCGLCIGWGLLSVVPLPMAPPRVFSPPSFVSAGAHWRCALEVVQGCHFTSVRIGGGAGLPLHLCGLCIGWGLLSVRIGGGAWLPLHLCGLCIGWGLLSVVPLLMAPPPCVFPPIVCLCRCALEVVQGCHFTSVRIGGGAGLTLHLCGLCIGWGLLSVRIGGGAGMPLHLCAHWRCALEVVQGCHFTSVRIGGGAGLPLHLCGLCIGWGLLSVVPLLMASPPCVFPPIVCLCRCALEVVQGCHFTSVRIGGGAGLPLHLCAHWRCALEVVQGCHFTSVGYALAGASSLCALEVVQGCHFTSVRIGGGAGLPLHLCGLCIGWGLLSVVPLLMVPPGVFSPPSFVSAGAHWRCALEVVQGCHFTSVRIGGGAGLHPHFYGLRIGWEPPLSSALSPHIVSPLLFSAPIL
ncbi:unnamed protein product [Closterium sp. NIES-65]|nr:unnamed protein product [Closterium sp. NIES-65]